MLKETNEPTAQNGPLVTQVKTMSTTGSVEQIRLGFEDVKYDVRHFKQKKVS